MGKRQHTPGPWRVAMEPEYDVDYITADRVVGGPTGDYEYDREGGVFAVIDGEPETICRPDTEADARLIAAAPDMLAALRDLLGEDAERLARLGVPPQSMAYLPVKPDALRRALDLATALAPIAAPGTPRVYRCTICGVNAVDAENGYDTCAECLAKA